MSDPGPQKPRKRIHVWLVRLILLGVGVILGAGVVFGLGGHFGSSATTTIPTFAHGDYVQRNGGLTVKVMNLWKQNAIGRGPDDPLRYHVPRGMWVIVKLYVRNDSHEMHSFDAMWQHLIMGGNDYSSDKLASGDVGGGTAGSASLNPGFDQYVAVAFDVPTDAVSGLSTAQLKVRMEPDASPVTLAGTPDKPDNMTG